MLMRLQQLQIVLAVSKDVAVAAFPEISALTVVGRLSVTAPADAETSIFTRCSSKAGNTCVGYGKGISTIII